MKTQNSEKNISAKLLSDFCDYLNENMGLYYPEKAWNEFEKKVPEISASFGYEDSEECLKWIINQPVSKDLITTLAQHLTIGETYFFRDKDTIDLVTEKVLVPLIEQRKATNNKHIKIWSAACCTGEEPYTYAMVLNELIPDKEDWTITVLGSDINIEFLKRAKSGIYREWSFRTIPEYYVNKYFKKTDDAYKISHEIRKMVRFSYLNLIEDQYPSLINGTCNIDLVLCNNVLIYFSKEQIKHVIEQLDKSLNHKGYLSVTPIEAPYIDIPNLRNPQQLGCNIFQSRKVELSQNTTVKPKILSDISRDLRDKKAYIHEKSSFWKKFIAEKPAAKEEEPVKENFKKPYIDGDANQYLKTTEEHFSKGSYENVIQILEEYFSETELLIHRRSIDALLFTMLIKSHVNLGNIEEAKHWSEKGLLVERTDPTLYYLHAALLQEFNCIPEAVDSLKKAIFLDSDFAIAYFTLANMMLILDNTKEAKRNFRNVVMILEKYDEDAIVPESDGLSAARLKEIVENIIGKL